MGIIEGFAVEGFLSQNGFNNMFNNKTITEKDNVNKGLTTAGILGFEFAWGIGTIINIGITLLSIYFYIKCNWSKKGKFNMNVGSVSDKIVGFLAACCCSMFYVAYHLVVPC